MKREFKLFNSKKRFFVLFVVIFGVFAVVIGRLLWLQIVRGEDLAHR